MQTKHFIGRWILNLAVLLMGTSSAFALPNLVPQNISLGASSVVAGGTLTVNWTLANTGSSSSPSTVTGVRLNQSSTSFTATYTSFANVSMPALNANSSTPQSTTITIPAGATPGTYYIWIIADNVTTGAITQSNYADDEQHSVSFTVTAPAQLPNLVPQNISLGASSVVAGNTLTVNWTLANTGGGSSPSTVTGVRLNQSSTSFTATYTSFANVSMPALNANSSTPQSTTITIPAGATPGTYYIWIIADNVTTGAITQSNYADDEQHSVSFTVTAPAQLPNLVPQNISLGASSVVAGNTLTVNWTLANTGGGSSPSTVTGVRLNQSSTSFTATYTSFANVSMPALSANSSTPQSTTITVPAGTTPGTYYVWIIADNVTSGAITQSSYTDDEQPSAAFTVTAPAQLPNLVPQNISLGAGSVVAGNTLTVNWTLANTGGGSSPSTVTGVRLNQSSTSFTATYTSFANVSMPALSANSSTPQSTTITVPAGTTPGTYYVWIIADNVTSGAITQSSYTDDEQPSAAFTVTAPAQLPNLVPQNISLGAGSVVAGNTLTVNWTLANTGGGSSPSTVTGVRLNQSSTSFTASYTSFANVSMPALSANSSTPQSTTITVPAGTTSGTYYVWIIADNVTSGAITQSSYTDDEQPSAAFTVTAPTQLPNLVPENITLSATTVAPGGSLTVNWTLADTGGGNSPSTVTGVRINQSTTSFAGTTLADVSMPALNANSSTPQSTTIAVPTTPGTYYVWIIADNVIPANAISQSNYGDDEQHSVAFTVTGTLPVYNSQSAIAYARNFAKYVCSDGYFWDWSDISASNPANVGAGNPVPTGSSCDEGIGDDCAHFVSCCIGTEPNEKGGGLAVPNTTGTSAYGNPSANGLVDWLLSGSAVRESSISDLAPGDVIGYDLTGSGTVTHVVFYLGNGNVAAHAQSRLDFPWNQYPYYNVWFVHIPGGNAVLNVSATSLTLPTTTQGTAGATTTFTISGSGLGSADSLTLEAPTGSEISENGGSGFANTLLLYPDSSGTLPTTTVYARISASATANVNGNLTIQDALNNALDKTILVGSVSLATDAQKQSLILQMINSHRGILPPELALAVIFQEGGQGAFYVDGSVLSPFFYRQADGPWAQPDDNNDGVMQVQQASRASGLTGPYPNTQSGYDVAISDGCSYLLTQYQSYETLWESVLHYNSGGASLYIYDNGEGDPQYLYHVASNLRNLVPALYGINNAQLADQLNAAQNIVNTYLQNSAILPNQSQSYYTAYQAQMDSALHALGSVSTKNLTLTASLSFGNIAIGSSQTLLMNVANNGNSTLTVNSINYPNGFSGNWASGPISPGGSVNVTVAFTPGNSTGYGGNITINSDATSGASEVAVSGAGVNTQPVTYFVTPGAGGNGSINPSTTQSVNNSGAISFAATPSIGYVVSRWLVNNVTAQISGPIFTVTNVTAATSVQVVFTSLLPPPEQLSSASFGGGIFSFNLNGLVGSNFVVEVSSDLLHWRPLSSNTISSEGSVAILDTNAAAYSQQFYRAVPTNSIP